jgi:hypothetical protein
LSQGALATAPTAANAAQVVSPTDLAATPDQLAKAATAADVGGPTVAQAQTTDAQFVAKAAQLGITPQALAATGYTLGAANAAEMEKTIVEQAAKAGAAEQAVAAQAAAAEEIKAATFTGTTPQAVAASQYTLDATKSAEATNTAVQAAAKAARDCGRGVGFVLNGDGIACIDLDHCIVDGRLTDLARGVLAAAAGAYVEVSPSGTGLHVWGLASVGKGVRRDGVEVYDRGRYMTVTGRRWRGAGRGLVDIQPLVDSLI